MKLLPALFAAVLISTAQAQTFKLDDSTSPQPVVGPRAVVDESGRPLHRSLEPSHAIIQFGQVTYRLDMREHLQQRANVYFVRAPSVAGNQGSRLNWRLEAHQQTGSLLGGERALVWSGRVEQPWMELGLSLDVELNLMRWRPAPGPGAGDYVTYFELERLP